LDILDSFEGICISPRKYKQKHKLEATLALWSSLVKLANMSAYSHRI